MRIWIFHCYGTLPEHGQMTRHYNFGKYLSRLGHEPIVFVGSHPHNTDLQLIDGNEKFKVYQDKPFPWVLVKINNYGGNKIKRLWSMAEYYFNAKKAAKHFGTPDVVLGSSNYPVVAYLGLRLAKKYKAKGIVEIRDLWPESLVAYGIAKENSLIVKLMRRFEKYLYKTADEVIFTMEGGYDYIKDQGWDKEIPESKVHFINNGVDLEEYDYNKDHYAFPDPDLDDPGTYKVVYTGSFRKANEQIMRLMDVIRLMQGSEYEDIRFLLYGSGDLVGKIQSICEENGYKNILIKGNVEKKYIPYILSKCDLNILNLEGHEILRYGGSQNKMFDYLASGHPTITGDTGKYSVIAREQCGVARDFKTPEDILSAIMEMRARSPDREHIRQIAQEYDYRVLTQKLLDAIDSTKKEG